MAGSIASGVTGVLMACERPAVLMDEMAGAEREIGRAHV